MPAAKGSLKTQNTVFRLPFPYNPASQNHHAEPYHARTS